MEIKIGKKYGELEVLEEGKWTESRHCKYQCKCHKCGNIVYATKERLMMNNPVCYDCGKSKDLRGMRINEFKVISKAPRTDKNRRQMWKCQCTKCGNTIEISSWYIIHRSRIPNLHCKCETIRQNLNKMFVEQILEVKR